MTARPVSVPVPPLALGLWTALGPRSAFLGRGASVDAHDFAARSVFPAGVEPLRGRSVLIIAEDPLAVAQAVLELAGVARRMVLCTPDVKPPMLAEIAAR